MRPVNCSLCGSPKHRVYAAESGTRNLHGVWVRCMDCGLFYANPRASMEEISDYYARYYEEGEFSSYLDDPEVERLALIEGAKMAGRIKETVPKGKFLDVGFGVGFMMKAALDAGFEVWGNEISPSARAHAAERWGVPSQRLKTGTLEAAMFDDEMFDCVFAWHIIEHVSDLGVFMDELSRVLKPGGLLVLGTENNRNLHDIIGRTISFARGRVPKFPTAAEHTFGFTLPVLKRLLNNSGFSITSSRIYEDNWLGSYLRKPDAPRLGKRAKQWFDLIFRRYPLYLAGKLVKIGRMVEVFAVKEG
ncbi:class I SAM-dependent methyltransferase [Candidatus Hydrogenedentota bacterium]